MIDPARFNPGLSIRNRLLLQLGVVAFVISISLFLLARQVIVQAVTATQDGLLNAAVQSIVDKITVIDGTVSLDLPYDTFSLLGAVGEDRIFYRIAENDRFLTGYEDFPYDGVALGNDDIPPPPVPLPTLRPMSCCLCSSLRRSLGSERSG